MVGLSEEGGNYRRAVIGAAVAGTVGLALYTGVKQYTRWRAAQTSADNTDKSTTEEGKTGEESSKSGVSTPEKSKKPPKKPEEPSKPSSDPTPSKPPTVIKGKASEASEKDEKSQMPKTSGAETHPIKDPSKEKPGPSKDIPKVPIGGTGDPTTSTDDKKKEEAKPPKKVEDIPKPQPPKPVKEKEPVSSRPGEAVKTDTDIVVIEEPWQWSQPPEKSPKAEDVHRDVVKQVKALSESISPLAASSAAEKVEALVKEVGASAEPTSMPSLGDDIEIIQDGSSLGDSSDFVKFDPVANVMAQASPPKKEEGVFQERSQEKEPTKPKEESKIPKPVKDEKKTAVVQPPKSETKKDLTSAGQDVKSTEDAPKVRESQEVSKD